jgi:hypothetical protein
MEFESAVKKTVRRNTGRGIEDDGSVVVLVCEELPEVEKRWRARGIIESILPPEILSGVCLFLRGCDAILAISVLFGLIL